MAPQCTAHRAGALPCVAETQGNLSTLVHIASAVKVPTISFKYFIWIFKKVADSL